MRGTLLLLCEGKVLFPDDGVGNLLWEFCVEATPKTVTLPVVDPNGSLPRVSSRDVRAIGASSIAEIKRPNNGGNVV